MTRLSMPSPVITRGDLRKGFDMLCAKLQEREIRRLIGLPPEGQRTVEGLSTLDQLEDGCLYFINEEVTDAWRESLAVLEDCMVIAPKGSAIAGDWGKCLVLEADDPRAAITRVLAFIRAERRHPNLTAERRVANGALISPLSVIEGAVEIDDGVIVDPFCVIGPDVRIGKGTIIRSGARLFPRVVIGEQSVVGPNTVVGHDGYGY